MAVHCNIPSDPTVSDALRVCVCVKKQINNDNTLVEY